MIQSDDFDSFDSRFRHGCRCVLCWKHNDGLSSDEYRGPR